NTLQRCHLPAAVVERHRQTRPGWPKGADTPRCAAETEKTGTQRKPALAGADGDCRRADAGRAVVVAVAVLPLHFRATLDPGGFQDHGAPFGRAHLEDRPDYPRFKPAAPASDA